MNFKITAFAFGLLSMAAISAQGGTQPVKILKCSIQSLSADSSKTQEPTSCQAVEIKKQCMAESPGEPTFCDLAAKMSVKNKFLNIDADFKNAALALWYKMPEQKSMSLVRVNQASLETPDESFLIMLPILDKTGTVTDSQWITCKISDKGDSSSLCQENL